MGNCVKYKIQIINNAGQKTASDHHVLIPDKLKGLVSVIQNTYKVIKNWGRETKADLKANRQTQTRPQSKLKPF